MATYESYKDSGVKWLGQIPSHWEVKKCRAFFDEITQQNLSRQHSNQLQFQYGTIVPKANQVLDEDVWKTISKYTVVQPGDIVINGLNLNYDLISQRIGIVRESGVITSAYISIRPKDLASAKFYEYLLKALDARKTFHGFGTGVRATLSWKELKHKLLPVVPSAEQEAIVAYLDKVTGEIDRAIEAQQKMIDALNARKKIIITRAFQNENSEWNSIPFRHVFEMRGGYTPSKADPSLWENGTIPWYRMEDIRKSGRFLNEAIQYVNRKAVKAKGTFKAGSYILAICTASIGEHAMLIADSLANQQFANLKIRKSLEHKLSPMFIFYYLYVVGDFCRNNANSTCFQYVDMEGLKKLPVPIPPIEEQKDIVTRLDKDTSTLTEAISDCERLIALLTERKQIIINEVVTGKKKVN